MSRPLPAASAADLVRDRLPEAPYRYQVTATVRLPAATVRARLPRLLPARLHTLDAGTCRIELGDDALGALVGDLARLDADLRLEGPPETLGAIEGAAQRLAAATRPGAGRG